MVWEPLAFLYIPLRRKREIVFTSFGEVPLLPAASINEGNLVKAESANWIVVDEVPEYSFRMLLWIPDHVSHARLFPAIEQGFVTRLAALRPDKASLLLLGSRSRYEQQHN